jgi:7-cyano-7-deazaguanine reductase
VDKEGSFTRKIEEMTAAEVAERIAAAMEFRNPNPITTIPYAGKVSQVVTYESAELIARCPMTGYPDFYRIRLTLAPGELLPELKSLKLYYYGFAELPISHEHLAAKIYTEFCEAVRPVACRLDLTVGIRGGIETTILVGEKEI